MTDSARRHLSLGLQNHGLITRMLHVVDHLARQRSDACEPLSPEGPGRAPSRIPIDEMQAQPIDTVSKIPTHRYLTTIKHRHLRTRAYLELPPAFDTAVLIDVSLELCSFDRPVSKTCRNEMPPQGSPSWLPSSMSSGSGVVYAPPARR